MGPPMSSARRSFAVLSLSLAFGAAALVGCAAPSDDGEVGDSSGASTGVTSDARARLVEGTVSATLLEGSAKTSIDAAHKLAALAKAFEAAPLVSAPGLPRCPPTWTVTFLDAQQKALGTLQRCGGSGFLKIGTKVSSLSLADADVHRAFGADMSELLEGADSMVEAASGHVSAEPEKVAAWVKAFDPKELPATTAPEHTDEALLTFTFRKAGSELVTVTAYAPKDDKAMTTQAKLTRDAKELGWVTLDLGRVFGGGF